jgi:LysB family phage lysis regulatory protein
MTALGEKLARVLALVAMAAMAYLYVDGLQAKLAKAEGDTKAAQEAIAARDEVITELRDLAHRRDLVAARMEGERDGIRQGANNREILMRKLQDENAEIRSWAAAAVPGPVVRLREHGPITGAAAYRQFLSEGAGLQPASGAGPE